MVGEPKENVPVPDPTVLTQAAIERAADALKELVFIRLEAMDEAIKVAKSDLVRVPTDVNKEVGNLRSLTVQMLNTLDEKFATIYERFRGVDAQFSQRDIAVAAALQAQKEAAGAQTDFFTTTGEKSEAAVAKQIDALLLTLTGATANLDSKLQDLKERMTRLEAGGVGRVAQTMEQRASAGEMRSYIAMAVSLVFLALAIAGLVIR